MEKFKRSFSMRKSKRDPNMESSKPHQWQEDERKVREGTCSFQVKYLGCIEVFESRGIQICEEAVKALKSRKSRSAWSLLSFRKKRDGSQQSKSNHHRAILYVTGDALRVVDEISKGLIVDQTIEKVSFCAPDRNHDKGFAYICRDGTTRRWMCHGFLAVKESGERLSHAVGCAFAICLEKKQQREKEKVTVTYNENGTSFTRMGSFRQTTLTERLADPQSALVAEPVPVKKVDNPYAVQRPHAPVDLIEQRQGSFRGFTRLADSSPFKRNVSLRVNELPSTLDRQRQVASGFVGPQQQGHSGGISVIMEAEEQQEMPAIADACRQLSEGLAAFSMNSNANSSANVVPSAATVIVAPPPAVTNTTTLTGIVAPQHSQLAGGLTTQQSQSFVVPRPVPGVTASPFEMQPAVQQSVSNNAVGHQFSQFGTSATSSSPAPVIPMRISNPWAGASAAQPAIQPAAGHPAASTGKVSEAEFWLNTTANQIDPFACVPNIGSKQAVMRSRAVTNGTAEQMMPSLQPVVATGMTTNTVVATVHHQQVATGTPNHNQMFNASASASVPQHQHPLRAPDQHPHHVHMTMRPDQGFCVVGSPEHKAFVATAAQQPFDPFDSAWASKTSNRNAGVLQSAVVNNPFQSNVDKVTPAFQVQL